MILRRDPEAGRAKEILDREVSSLEPYMEALPSLFVLLYLSLAEPAFFHSAAARPAETRAYWVASFTMTLFLKNGPCFFLPREGFFSGICTWKFWAVFIVNNYGLHSKICWPRDGVTLLANMISVFLLSATLALLSLRQALASWRNVSKIVLRFPALLILPIVGYFTFGPTNRTLPQDISGVAINWKWTFVNMVASLILTTCFGFLDLTQPHLRALHLWLTDYSGCDQFFRGCTYFSYIIGTELGKVEPAFFAAVLQSNQIEWIQFNGSHFIQSIQT